MGVEDDGFRSLRRVVVHDPWLDVYGAKV